VNDFDVIRFKMEYSYDVASHDQSFLGTCITVKPEYIRAREENYDEPIGG